MIILDCEQGTEEWNLARLGIPTSSMFSKIITTKGEPSESRYDYMDELAIERITGKPTDRPLTYDMRIGREREPEALDYFELVMGLDVQRVGFCYKDELKNYGSSPDGLIGDNDGLEVKCPKGKTQLKRLRQPPALPTDYFQQVQGNLHITDRERWHFLSYYPGLDHMHVIVERDEIWIAKFSKAIKEFNEELEAVYQELKD